MPINVVLAGRVLGTTPRNECGPRASNRETNPVPERYQLDMLVKSKRTQRRVKSTRTQRRVKWRLQGRDEHDLERAGTAPEGGPAPRERRQGGPSEDRALYTCQCGYAFEAPVTTSVGCPHCACTQAW